MFFMNYLLYFLMSFFIFIFFFSFTPLVTIFSIVGQTLSMINFNLYVLDLFWFSLMVVLLYLGGVMVIFLYLNSVSNKIIIKQNNYYFLFLLFVLTMGEKKNFNFFSGLDMTFMFYSIKEFYFIWFIIFLFIFIYLINNLILMVKSPLNNNL